MPVLYALGMGQFHRIDVEQVDYVLANMQTGTASLAPDFYRALV